MSRPFRVDEIALPRSTSETTASDWSANEPMVVTHSTEQGGGAYLRFQNAVMMLGAILALAWLAPLSAMAQEDPPEALRLASEAGNLQNAQQFDLAAELWDDYLEKYPESSLAAKARHYSGVCHMKAGALDSAVTRFEAVVEAAKEDPSFALLEDALLNLGWCEFTLASAGGDGAASHFQKSQKWLEQLLKDYPEGSYRDQAVYFLGEGQYLSGKVSESVAFYRQLIADFPESSLVPNAIYALGVALDETDKRDEAIAAFDRYLADYPESELASEIEMRRAETLLRGALATEAAGGSPDWAAIAASFGKLADREGFGQADRATYQRAFSLAKQGDATGAAAGYASLVERFPQSPIAADARLAAGRAYYSLGQHQAGATMLAPLLDAAGARRGEAAHWWARCQWELGAAAESYTKLTELEANLANDPFAAQVAFDRAEAAYRTPAQQAQSRDPYIAVADRFSGSTVAPQALYNAAFEDFTANRYDSALALVTRFAQAYASDPFLVDMRALEAECRLAKGEPAAAATIWDALIKQGTDHPDRDRWPLRLALARFNAKDYAAVVAQLEAVDAFARPEWRAEAAYLLGSALFFQGKAEPAIASLEKAVVAESGWSQTDIALVMLARAQAKADQLTEAKATLTRLLENYPNSSSVTEAHYRLGEIAEKAEDAAEARRQYALVAQQANHPFAPFALVADAWLAYDAGQWTEAEASFRAVAEGMPSHTLHGEAALGLGMSLRQLGRNDDAFTVLSAARATETDPERRREMQFEEALALMGAKRYEQAETELKSMIDAFGDWSRIDQVMYQYAWAAKYRNDAPTATTRFASLVEAQPESPLVAECRFHQGEAAYDAGQFEQAATFYSQALAGQASQSIQDNASYKLGWTQYKQGKLAEAREMFTTLAGRNPSGLLEQTRFMVAECYFDLKDYANAYTNYSNHLAAIEASAVAGDAIKQLARLHAAQAANKLKKHDEALELAEGFVERYDESPSVADAWFEIGEARRGKNEINLAVEAYETAASTGSARLAARSRCMVGEIYFAQETYDEAVKQFRRVMFGYDESAPAEVKTWQAFAGYEAGRCAQVQAAAAQGAMRDKWIEEAVEAFRYVVERHPQDRLAAEARKQIEKLNSR